MAPGIYWLLITGHNSWALFFFIIAASTDFIDGALARTRNQITDLGKVADPIADKLLIASVLAYVGLGSWVVRIFFLVMILEALGALTGAFLSFSIGRPLGANFFGKIKMILQSLSVTIFILGGLVGSKILTGWSESLLVVALIFAILAGVRQAQLKMKHIVQNRKKEEAIIRKI